VKTYYAPLGFRDVDVAEVLIRNADGTERPLPLRLDVINHSPTGFAWGYGGSGPAQLALAIACDLVGAKRAVGVYQSLKSRVIAALDQNVGWELDEDLLRQIIDDIEHDQGVREVV